MGNHSIDCPVCGEDLRGLGGGCAVGCLANDSRFSKLSTEEKRNAYRVIYKITKGYGNDTIRATVNKYARELNFWGSQDDG